MLSDSFGSINIRKMPVHVCTATKLTSVVASTGQEGTKLQRDKRSRLNSDTIYSAVPKSRTIKFCRVGIFILLTGFFLFCFIEID